MTESAELEPSCPAECGRRPGGARRREPRHGRPRLAGDAAAAASLPARGGPRARRGRSRGRQDRAREGARAVARPDVPPRRSSRPTCSPRTSPASTSSTGRAGVFRFRPGPVFANVVLVDEINRASPKTQSALLEAMQEGQVTVDGATHVLVRPFLVIATQNPVEYEGTYPLPEAQLDRFAVRMTIGYPPHADEARMLAEQTTEPPLDQLEPVATHAELVAAIEASAAGARGGVRQPVRRRAPAPHPRKRPARARRQPALRDRPAPPRQGARARRAPRLRRPGGRRRARRPRARALD